MLDTPSRNLQRYYGSHRVERGRFGASSRRTRSRIIGKLPLFGVDDEAAADNWNSYEFSVAVVSADGDAEEVVLYHAFPGGLGVPTIESVYLT
ncbi:hypothetical protein C9J85_18150 [Haloferax sp. wsp5]|nr:hypothetical protein C9J85_18150 [Haloferax sp. wsp5]